MRPAKRSSPWRSDLGTCGETAAARLLITGAVQGVGFRPFVHRLAHEIGVRGTVSNSGAGVEIHVEGERERCDELARRVATEAPSAAVVEAVSSFAASPAGAVGFAIEESALGGANLSIGPDLATCGECLKELFDAADRRYRYPFLNCTACGPRYTITTGQPYDRQRTTMAGFTMCAPCKAEYEDKGDRRFHAQPSACAECGPRLEWRAAGDGDAGVPGDPEHALRSAVQSLAAGEVVAVQGLGGFHLMVRADRAAAVARLRDRKQRGSKPFAVMFANLDDLRAALGSGAVSAEEESALVSPVAPIVLIRKGERQPHGVDAGVAPTSPDLGCMLAANPLHHLLLRDLGAAVVATSGNRSEEPICTTLEEARQVLAGIADGYLVHDRGIARPIDDSIVRVIEGDVQVLRRARGLAPLWIQGPLSSGPMAGRLAPKDMAVGGYGKCTVGLRVGSRVLLSPHLGDLSTVAARQHHLNSIRDLSDLAGVRAERVICDRHPDYASTVAAESLSPSPLRVQHHLAHAAAAAFEFQDAAQDGGASVALTWDGSGFGDDGTVWGGEALSGAPFAPVRGASIGLFALPGGEGAARSPWRCAAGLLRSVFDGAAAPLGLMEAAQVSAAAAGQRALWRPTWTLAGSSLAVRTSSVGRLFDAAAALLGLAASQDFEADAAMRMESAAVGAGASAAKPYELHWQPAAGLPRIDHTPWLEGLARDLAAGESIPRMAARFHGTLAEAAFLMASKLAAPRKPEDTTVTLTGGCFQNRFLLELTAARLRRAGFRVRWPEKVPPGDGGIALGQLAATMSESHPWPPASSGAQGYLRSL